MSGAAAEIPDFPLSADSAEVTTENLLKADVDNTFSAVTDDSSEGAPGESPVVTECQTQDNTEKPTEEEVGEVTECPNDHQCQSEIPIDKATEQLPEDTTSEENPASGGGKYLTEEVSPATAQTDPPTEPSSAVNSAMEQNNPASAPSSAVVHPPGVDQTAAVTEHLRRALVGGEASQTALERFITFFGRIRELNITFCIDTSGSMISYLDTVKEHLIEALVQRAQLDEDNSFNVIEFSTDVRQWSDKLIKTSPETTAVACQWIKSLHPQTGTNTERALLSALSDEACEAVYFVTDGLPDNHPADVLNRVSRVARNRPVHCFYVQDARPDAAVSDFLRNLAMETYGSFHIITIARHGNVERVTPIYRADTAAERIIRTTSGDVYPTNLKFSSSTERLGVTPVHETDLAGPGIPLHHFYPWPYRFYYHHYSPYVSGYRAALRQHEELFYRRMITASPGAGALIVGCAVLARRTEDGLFYRGSIKAQLLSDKFLVEFGPCTRGSFRETSYQETYVYDIVSYDDAMRHTILTGDRVLAPWKPDGEVYGPGLAIEGQEHRLTEAASSGVSGDTDLVVTFFNGMTSRVPLNTAVWIPAELHERITFELKLPDQVRRGMTTHDSYPDDNIPGFPVSVVRPREYDVYEPQWVAGSGRYVRRVERSMYPTAPYLAPYPARYPAEYPPGQCPAEDETIPGTHLTKSELNEKIMAQLMQHKMSVSGKESSKESGEKLLSKREAVSESVPVNSGILKKSVTFDHQNESDLEAEFDAGDLECRDSGRGSTDELYLSDMERSREDTGTQTSRSLTPTSFRRRRHKKRSDPRPRWQYWSGDPAPSLMDPMHYGPHRVGPYDSTSEPVPLELRKSQSEWTSPVTRVVDPLATRLSSGTVRESLMVPRPPQSKPDKQGPGRELSEVLGLPLTPAQQLAAHRADYRHKASLARELRWMDGVEERERMRLSMEDQHRDRVRSRLDARAQRRADEWNALQRSREVKKQISEAICQRIEENQERERERSAQREGARQANRQRREEIAEQRQREIEVTIARRQAIKADRVVARSERVEAERAERESQAQSAALQRRLLSAARRQHFRDVEDAALRHKQLTVTVADVHRGHYRARVLP